MIIEPTGTHQVVTGAIRQAARMTGAAFKYLLATAQVESNLNPNAQAATSSARGLFQFTEQTWLTTLKEQGGPLGYGPYASAISRQASGDYAVSDPRMADAVNVHRPAPWCPGRDNRGPIPEWLQDVPTKLDGVPLTRFLLLARALLECDVSNDDKVRALRRYENARNGGKPPTAA
jgi:hypothetical protein